MNLEKRQLWGGLALIVVPVVALAFVGGFVEWRFPAAKALDATADAATVVFSFLLGLGVLAFTGFLLYLAIKDSSTILGILAFITLFAGLTLVGVTVGVPDALEPVIALLNTIVKILNGILSLFGRLF